MKIAIAHKSTARKQKLFFLGMIVLFIPCMLYLDLSYTQFLDGVHRIPNILSKFMEISFDELPMLLAELLTSVVVAFLCVVISVIISLLLAFVMADNTSPNRFVSGVLRAFVVVVRTIPTTVWVLLAVASMGFGPMAGVLGLIFPTVSFLIKEYSLPKLMNRARIQWKPFEQPEVLGGMLYLTEFSLTYSRRSWL